jgi:hypothetical protein
MGHEFSVPSGILDSDRKTTRRIKLGGGRLLPNFWKKIRTAARPSTALQYIGIAAGENDGQRPKTFGQKDSDPDVDSLVHQSRVIVQRCGGA